MPSPEEACPELAATGEMVVFRYAFEPPFLTWSKVLRMPQRVPSVA
jgi:hypothetical protein